MVKLKISLGRNIKQSVLVSVLCVSACSEQPSEIDLPSDGVVHLEQGWNPAVRVKAHHTSFGSRLIPLDWMLQLESENFGKLVEQSSIERLGFLAEPKSKINPHGLPVGFTIDTDQQGTQWVGLGCAACHTGEVHHQGQRIRLEGGQGLINFTLFETTVMNALQSTLTQPAKLQRFKSNLEIEGDSERQLVASMNKRLSYLKNRQAINKTEVDYGYGRLDAFGQIFNTVGVELLQIPSNRLVPDAPVSFPVLWDAPHLDLVQWNGSAPNAGPGPLLQNITTAIAVYGETKIVGSETRLGYQSSVNIEHLKKIQNWLYQLRSPKWPENILGKLDPDKLHAGKKVYRRDCLQCHQLVNSDKKKYKLKATLTPVSEVNTDSTMVDNFLRAKVDSGTLEGKKLLWIAGNKIARKEKSINLVAHVAAGVGLHHPLQTLDAVVEDYHPVYKTATDSNPNYYKARPLTGIWASAPYLHNGSVMTLDELLSPVEQRRVSFYIGDRTLDVQKVGLVSTKGENRSFFNTRLKGNGNSGHLYGAQLSIEEKSALLEYLKSL